MAEPIAANQAPSSPSNELRLAQLLFVIGLLSDTLLTTELKDLQEDPVSGKALSAAVWLKI